MGSKKKKSEKNAAFKKVKLKIGKVLKKTNTTDSTVESRKVVLLTQLEEQTGNTTAVYSYRGLGLDHLCTQLGHYSKNVRKNAIVGAKQILTSAPHLIESHLRTIIPAFARLITITDTDSATNAQLRSLFELVCSVPPLAISAHFPLFAAHVLRGLTHSHETVRSFALSVLHILMDKYPTLCRENTDIFQTLIHFFVASKKTSHSTKVLLDFIASFLRIYDEDAVQQSCRVDVFIRFDGDEPTMNKAIDLCIKPKNVDPFYFPVLTSSSAGASSSLFSSPEALLKLTQALSPLVARVMHENDRNLTAGIVKILNLMRRALDRQQNKFMMVDFDERYAQATDHIRKAAKVKEVKENKKIAAAVSFLMK